MKIAMLFVLFLIGQNRLYAQYIHTDSLEIKRKIAFADARRFKPTKQIKKAFRQHILSNTSDYFKPTIQHVSNLGLLQILSIYNCLRILLTRILLEISN